MGEFGGKGNSHENFPEPLVWRSYTQKYNVFALTDCVAQDSPLKKRRLWDQTISASKM